MLFHNYGMLVFNILDLPQTLVHLPLDGSSKFADISSFGREVNVIWGGGSFQFDQGKN